MKVDLPKHTFGVKHTNDINDKLENRSMLDKTVGAIHWVLYTGYYTLGAIHWVLYTGCYTLGTIHWVLCACISIM